jgi:hypothetical protein
MTAQVLGSTSGGGTPPGTPPPVLPPTTPGGSSGGYREPRTGIVHTLTNLTDGTVWAVSEWESHVYLVEGSLEGLGMPEVVNWKTSSPHVDGHQWDGYIVPGRRVFFYLAVWHNGTAADWVDKNDELWKMFYPGNEVLWTVEVPGSQRGRRSLRLRFEKCADSFDTDPTYCGWAVYGLELSPEQPFWEGDEVSKELTQKASVDFFANELPFTMSGEESITSATIDNPGTAPSYVQWRVDGPTTSVSVGVNGGTTTYTPDLILGDVLEINTDPRDLGAEKNGVDVTGALGTFQYNPIPPGKDIELNLAMAGTGKITVTFRPRFWRCI